MHNLRDAWTGSRTAIGVAADVVGLLFAAAVVLPVLIGFVGGSWSLALLVLLGLSLAGNVVLGVIAYRSTRYARDLEYDMTVAIPAALERRRDEMDQRRGRSGVSPWIPDAAGQSGLTNAVMEQALEDAQRVAREATAHDARVGLGWISLDRPLVSFNAFSPSAQRRLRVWVVPGEPAMVVQDERSSHSVYPLSEPQWRTDPTWSELLTQTWVTERPLPGGSVTLWPRHDSALPAGSGSWWIEYRRNDDGVISQPVRYQLQDGLAVRVPARQPHE